MMLQLEFNNTRNGRLGRQSEAETGLGSEASAMMMMTQGTGKADGTEKVNADDIFEEFLQDEDNSNLEVICSKWRGLDGFDVDSFSKICPEIANGLQEADKHVQEFLAYRRSLNEKHARKEAIKKETERKMRAVDAALARMPEDDESDALGEDGELSEPSSPASYGSRRKVDYTLSARESSDSSPRLLRKKPSFNTGDGAQGASQRLSQMPKGQTSRRSQAGNATTAVSFQAGSEAERLHQPSRLSQAGSAISGASTQAGPETERHQPPARCSQAGSTITSVSAQAGPDAERHHHVPGHTSKSSLLKSLGMGDQNAHQALSLYEKKLEKSQRK